MLHPPGHAGQNLEDPALSKHAPGLPAPAVAAAALSGLLAAGLLAAGCAAAPAARPQTAATSQPGAAAASQPGAAATSQPRAAVASCIRASVAALRHHVTLTSLPAACRGLPQARLSYAADAATAAVARSGSLHGKILMRARRRELSPLLPHLAPATVPQRGSQPATGAGAPAGLATPPAGLAALAAWLVTAGLGLWVMSGWLVRGMLRRIAGRRWARLRMNLAHLGLGLAGLVTWLSYLLTGAAVLAWLACALTAPVAGLGMALLFLRLPGRRAGSALALAAHIAFAVVTMLLTLLAAVTAG